MEFPTINQYKESVSIPECLDHSALEGLEPVKQGGQVLFTSGNFAVVFKMKHKATGEHFALKCFLTDRPDRAKAYREIEAELRYAESPYFVRMQYLEDAIWAGPGEKPFPVLLMPWVEGETLDRYVERLVKEDPARLHLVAYRFSVMASWLVNQPFAHGDIKPDNILVRKDGAMVLVDYDGLYVPSMQGWPAREAGTPAFRHPRREQMSFGEQIDDFPLVSIALSLLLIAHKPSLLCDYGAKDRLLFTENDYRNLAQSRVLPEVVALSHHADVQRMYGLFLIALSEGHLQRCENRLLLLPPPRIDFAQPTNIFRTLPREFCVNGVRFKMIYVEGGSFMMGAADDDSEAYDDEKPRHKVTLDGYYMAETQVTQALWEAVMGSNPSEFKGANRPVECVTWNDCQEFLKKLNALTGQQFCLPTEAQWEYAARGGKRSKGYKYAGGNNLDSVAWWDENPNDETQDVKQKQPNELGLYDMTGNVWERCNDWFDKNYYANSSEHNPQGPGSGDGRVLRGGCWYNGARICRLSCRSYGGLDGWGLGQGLRLALLSLQ